MKRRLSAILPISLLLLAVLAVVYLFALREQESRQDAGELRITELMCRNSASVTDESGSFCQWIELKNVSDVPVELADYSLRSGDMRAALPMRSVAPGSFVLLRESDWGFPLAEDGSLSLLKNGIQVSVINYVNRTENCSWLAETGEETGRPTPGYDAVLAADQLQLSEVMSSNADCIVKGQLCDWVELYNAGNETLRLSDYYLSKDESEPYASRLPDVTLESGEYIIFCCGSDIDFNIGKSGCALYLTRWDGVGASALAVPAMKGGESFTYDLGVVSAPSPGRANNSAPLAPTGLYISEIISANNSFLPDENGEYSDLVELYNGGSESVTLSDYCLSDSKNELLRWALPDITVEAGQYCVLRCSTGPFAISAQGERLYLSRHDGTVVDALIVPAIPNDRSWGRVETELLYFTVPSLGAANGSGYASPVSVPVASVSSGFYEEGFSVTLNGEGSIYYTTDGTDPGVGSRLYTGESIRVNSTMSIRCYAADGERIPSAIVSYNYFVAQPDYELDVVMVTLAPKYRSQLNQNTNNYEYSANVALYSDGEEQFNLPCGISLFGSGSRAFIKKSFQISFRGAYGASNLDYRLFDSRDYDEYNSFVLRSGSQDQFYAMMRDEVLTGLWEGFSDSVLTLAYRPVNLYLNGEYCGIYYIRERCTEETVAGQLGVAEESVSVIKDVHLRYTANEAGSQELSALFTYIQEHDLSVEEHFRYVEEHLDIDSTIDFYIAQMWSNNYDINNARMYKSSENDGRWRFILYDLDVAFLRTGEGSVYRMLEAYNRLLESLMANEGFCERFTLRLGELLRGPLAEEAVIARVDAMEALLENDMVYSCRKWILDLDYSSWKQNVEFLRRRPFFGIEGRSAALIEEYISLIQPENELILLAFGEDYC